MHNFNESNGHAPQGDILLSDSTLFGVTVEGGDYGMGTVYALKLRNPTGSDDIKTSDKSDVIIYPNPTSGLFTLSFNSTLVLEFKVVIYNTNGKQVFSETYYNTTMALINLTGCPAGMYLVKVNDNGKSHAAMITKE